MARASFVACLARWARGWRTTIACATLIALLFVAGCSHQVVDAKVDDTVKVREAPDPNIATIDHPELFPVVSVELRQSPQELSVNGVVAPDVSRTVPVNAMSSGRVVEVRARLGDYVRKGQVLLTLTSPDLASAISDHRKAVADELLARRQLERSQDLFEHGATAQKDLQIAEDAEDKAKVDVQTTAEHIRILGGDANASMPIIELRAPVSGTIVEQNVTTAAGVKSLDNSPNLFTIADLSHVWMLCDVYENDLAKVRLGEPAVVTLNAYPDHKIQGRISNISSLLDPNTRTAKVRIDLANSGDLMKPNMFGTVVFTSQGNKPRLAVPAGAVLRLQDRDWVFVKLNDKQFRRTEVQGLPAGADGYQQIVAGVNPGDQVAANALQFSRAIENAQEQKPEAGTQR